MCTVPRKSYFEWFLNSVVIKQSHAKVTQLHWGLREVVRLVEQLALADLSVIHLVKMWHTVGGLCLWSISANEKQPSLSGLSCPPACSLVSAVSPHLKGAGNCAALLDTSQMAFPYKPQWDRKGKDTCRLQSRHISLQHLNKPFWSENGYVFTKHHWQFLILSSQNPWRWGCVGVNPSQGQLGLCLRFSLTPLCSLWTLLECTARMQKRNGICRDPTMDPLPQKPADHQASAACHSVATGNAEQAIGMCVGKWINVRFCCRVALFMAGLQSFRGISLLR